MKKYILVLDIDGTLTDTVALHQRAFLGAMQALALPALETDWGAYPHHTDTGILRHALAMNGRAEPSAGQLMAFEEDLARRFLDELAAAPTPAAPTPAAPIQPIPGAADFVHGLADSAWAVVFATGGVRAVSGVKLQAAGIPFSDAALFTASEEPARDALVARAIAHAHRAYPQTRDGVVVSMGDGLWDLKVAQQLGLRFLGVGSTAQALAARGAPVLPDLTGAAAALAALLAEHG
ncbi:HAD family hydrolase [Achromobacter sp. DH1f]|uniref:HAD family hydrolase n=1 Tax=Achromobacter sp. DH1f TaxID=1397275 RepID=UPI000468399F|nr:HAD family hydrolase [Achromobacter sp. DH1f]